MGCHSQIGIPQNLWEIPLFDVRSPGEFAAGHIPAALSLPLFSDLERAEVGTLYKQVSQKIAFERGLEFASSRLDEMLREVRHRAGQATHVRVMCWRGGMRSQSVCWMLRQAGIEAEVLTGGYKSWRRALLKLFALPWSLCALGGPTGAGKTDLLKELGEAGEQVLDLEHLASHRGSAWGHLGKNPQPSQEHFENLIGAALASCSPERVLWIEDESRMIGRCKIPDALFKQLLCAPLLLLESPLQERIGRLLAEYGPFPQEQQVAVTQSLQKRLGSQACARCIEYIQQGELRLACEILMQYYDVSYQHALKRSKRPCVSLDRSSPEFVEEVLQHGRSLQERSQPVASQLEEGAVLSGV